MQTEEPKVITLLEAIDKPIRNLVVEMNRIGLRTVFSCCGFHYKDEEEEKSHADHAFIIFKDPNCEAVMENFLRFTNAAHHYGWKIDRYGQNQWVIRYEIAPERRKFWSSHPETKKSLHDYELPAIAIYSLTKAVTGLDLPPISDYIEIVDGNQSYHDLGIAWQIEPKPSVVLHFQGVPCESHE